MKPLHRYAVIDEYTLAELRMKYESADTRGRIALLKLLSRHTPEGPPYEIAVLAANDPDVRIRHWLATNIDNLDYGGGFDWAKYSEVAHRLKSENQDRFLEFAQSQPDYQGDPARDLERKLQNDPEPLIRAAFFEKPSQFGFLPDVETVENQFREATHLERLALVRNPRLPSALIYRLLDPDDQDLLVTIDERKKLVLALLTNHQAFTRLATIPSYPRHDADGNIETLWRVLEKWVKLVETDPDALSVAFQAYRVLGTDEDTNNEFRGTGSETLGQQMRREKMDAVKAAAYSDIKNPQLREAILQSCSKWDTKTLELGLADEEERCQKIAASKSPEAKLPQSFRERLIDYVTNPSWHWRIVSRAILLAAMLFMWSRASTDFETVVLVAMALLYVFIHGVYAWAQENTMMFGLRQFEHTKKLRQITGEKLPPDVAQSQEAEVEAAIKKSLKPFFVDSVFSYLVVAICALALLRLLL